MRRYIERYLEIVTATSSQTQLNITFVDGYAGGGRYLAGRETVVGSPLIFLEAVAMMETKLRSERRKGFRINAGYIFIDKNPHHTEFLRAEIEASDFKSELDRSILIKTADFNEEVDDIIRAVRERAPRTGRAIFLLDQYGWSTVAFQSVRKILTELNKGEIFLTFSVDALIDYLSERSFDLSGFGNIDASPEFVRELVRTKEREQVGYRALIQNGLYRHVQTATAAPYYSPFFIKSPEAHRSYWFIHLSQHREARDAIGRIHWQENNTTIHHGGAGLEALGFAANGDIEQLTMSYLFDDPAKKLSRNRLREQLPQFIYGAVDTKRAATLDALFGLRCNDTPVIRELLEEVLISLRAAGEITIVSEKGQLKPRAQTIDWSDNIVLPPQRSFLSPFFGSSNAKKR